MFSSKCKNKALRIKIVEWQRNALKTMVGEDDDNDDKKSRDALEDKRLEYRSVEKLTTVNRTAYDKYPSAASSDVFDFEDNGKSFRNKPKQNVTVRGPKTTARRPALIFYPPSTLQKSLKSKRQHGSEFTVSPQRGATDNEDGCTLSPLHHLSGDDGVVTEFMENPNHRTSVRDTDQSQAHASVAVTEFSIWSNYPDPTHVEDIGSFHRDVCTAANGESAIDNISVTECPSTFCVPGLTEATLMRGDVSNAEMRNGLSFMSPVLCLNLATSPRPLSRKANAHEKFERKRYGNDSFDDESSIAVGKSTEALESPARSELTAKSSNVTSEAQCGKPTTVRVEILNEPPCIFDINDFVVISGKKYVAIESPSRDSQTDAGRCVSGSRDSMFPCKTASRTTRGKMNANSSTENGQDSVVAAANRATQRAARITDEIGERSYLVKLSPKRTFRGAHVTEQCKPSNVYAVETLNVVGVAHEDTSRDKHHENVHGTASQRQLKEIDTSAVSGREATGSEMCVLNSHIITSPSRSQVTPMRKTWQCSRKRGSTNRSLHWQFIESSPGSQHQSDKAGRVPIGEQRLATPISMHQISKTVRVSISRNPDKIEALLSPDKRIKIEPVVESRDQLVLSEDCVKINIVRSNDVEATYQRQLRRSASSRSGSSTSRRRQRSVSTSPKSTEPRADREPLVPEKTPSSTTVGTMQLVLETHDISLLKTPLCTGRTDPDRCNLKDAATPNSLTETPIRMLRDLDITPTTDKSPQYAVSSSVPLEVVSSQDVSAVIKRTVQDRCVVMGADSRKLDSINRETFQDSCAVCICVPTEQYSNDHVTGERITVLDHPGVAEHVHEVITIDTEQAEKITTRDDTAYTLDESMHIFDTRSVDEEHSWISIDGDFTSDGPEGTCSTSSFVADCESLQDEPQTEFQFFSLIESASSPVSTLMDDLKPNEFSFREVHKPESKNTTMSESRTCGDTCAHAQDCRRVATVAINNNDYVVTPLESYETQRRTSIGSPSTSDLVIRLEKCAAAMKYSYKCNQTDGHIITTQQNAPAAIIAERAHKNPSEQITQSGSSDTIRLAVLQSENSAAASSDTVLHEDLRNKGIDKSNVSPMRVGLESQRPSATRWAPKTLTMESHGRESLDGTDSADKYWEDVRSDSSLSDEVYKPGKLHIKYSFVPFGMNTKNGICGLCKLPRRNKIEKYMLVKIRKCDEKGEAIENGNKNLFEWRKTQNITNGQDSDIGDGDTDDESKRMPCAYCMKSVVKAKIHEHYRKCKKHGLYYDELTGDGAKAAVREYDVRRRADQSLLKELWNRMRNDNIKRIVSKDSLIRRYACLKMEALGAKESQKLNDITMISTAIRRMGKIVRRARRDFKGIGLSDLITPNKFDYVLKVVKDMLTEQKLCSPSVKIAAILRQLAGTKNGLALRDNDDIAADDARKFLLLIDCEWNRRINIVTNKMFSTDKISRVKILPLTEDLVKLRNHTLSEMKRLMEELKVVQTLGNWLALTHLTIVRLVTFNKRRSAEVATLKVNQYLQRPKWHADKRGELAHVLSPDDLMLAKSMDLVVNVGKSRKNVPAFVLLPPESRKAIDLLIKCRKSVDISTTNPYVFARPTADTPLYFHEAIRIVTRGCEGLQHPERICSNSLRKYVATVAQVAQTLLAVDNGRLRDFKSTKDISVTDLPPTGYNFDKCHADIKSPREKEVASVNSESLKTDKSDAAMEVPEVDVVSASSMSSKYLETASSDGKSIATYAMDVTNIPTEDNSLCLELLEPGQPKASKSLGEHDIETVSKAGDDKWWIDGIDLAPLSYNSRFTSSDGDLEMPDAVDLESLMLEETDLLNADNSFDDETPDYKD